MSRSPADRVPALRLIWRVFSCLTFSLLLLTAAYAAQPDDLWSGARSGRLVVLMRHAEAPGTGDPDEFALDDCRTQRNLSQTGREQAVRTGDLFRQRGIERARVFSSQWCRCRDTAEALALGPVVDLPALNSFFRDFSREQAQTRALSRWIVGQPREEGPLILVTHQVNITALADVFPASGELVFVRVDETGTISLAGRIRTD